MSLDTVQNGGLCSVITGLGKPLAERERYTRKHSAQGGVSRECGKVEQCPKWGKPALREGKARKARQVVKQNAGRVSPANAGRVTGVQNGGLQRTERTKRTGEKSRTPISPIGPMKKYADRVSKMRQNGVQNGVCCRAVRAGRRIETPLAERKRYTRKHSAQGLSKMRVTGVQNVCPE